MAAPKPTSNLKNLLFLEQSLKTLNYLFWAVSLLTMDLKPIVPLLYIKL